MGHDPAPQLAKYQAQNLAIFNAWIAAHGKLILPIPHRAVIYAGFPEGEVLKAKSLLNSHQHMRRMWQIIEFVDKNVRDYTGQVHYDKLNDVLRRLKGPLPAIVDTNGGAIGRPKKFADMLECAEKLTNPNEHLLDKGRFNYVWDTLSAQYVKNAKGEVEIWQGCKANHKQVDQSTTLIRTELQTLLARTDIPQATREAASKIVVSFVNHHRNQKIISEKLMAQAHATLQAARSR
jgi:hypothetical protein